MTGAVVAASALLGQPLVVGAPDMSAPVAVSTTAFVVWSDNTAATDAYATGALTQVKVSSGGSGSRDIAFFTLNPSTNVVRDISATMTVTLSPGINTFTLPAALAVQPGDVIGIWSSSTGSVTINYTYAPTGDTVRIQRRAASYAKPAPGDTLTGTSNIGTSLPLIQGIDRPFTEFTVGNATDMDNTMGYAYMYCPLRPATQSGWLWKVRPRLAGSPMYARFFTIDPNTRLIGAVSEQSPLLPSGGWSDYALATPIPIKAGECLAIAPVGSTALGVTSVNSDGLKSIRYYSDGSGWVPAAGATAPAPSGTSTFLDLCLTGHGRY